VSGSEGRFIRAEDVKDAGAGGKDIKAEGLDLITQGINLTLGELKEVGIDYVAGTGRGFDNLELSGLQLGHEDLTSAFKSFCERWEWGVRALVGEGNDFAADVGLAAGTLYETDQYAAGALKVGANSLMGNPHASEDDITKMTWSELAANNDFAHADYSKDSFEQAWRNSKQGWKDAGRDVMTSESFAGDIPGPQNFRQAAGMSDEQYGAVMDQVFGPSPEERAQGAGQQGGDAG
jgi:hypothetical protein